MPNYRLELTLKEPLTIGNEPMVSNEIRTLDYIPAVSLRGAIYQELCLNGLGDQVEAVLGIGGPRWSDAWPEGCIPMPRCFLQRRRDGNFGSRYGVIHTLAGREEDDGDRVRAGRWLKLSQQREAAGEWKVRTSVDMHVGLHYGRQANRETALFSREAIDPEQTFHAYVSGVPETARVIENINELSMGKRSSVNGRMSIQWQADDALGEKYSRATDGGGRVFLQLLTDAAIPSADGGWQRNFEAGAARVIDAVVTTRRSRGWAGAWGLPTEQIQVVEAGSVWVMEPAGDGEAFARWLRDLAAKGIGMRRHEGFGWVAVNPPWLQKDRLVEGKREVRADRGQEPEGWPESRIGRERQKTLAVEAAGIEFKAKVGPALETLLTMALRGANKEQVRAYLKKQSERGSAWEELEKKIGAQMESLEVYEPEFFLESLITEERMKGMRA